MQKPYEIAYFARKHGITQAQARQITKDFGPSRVRCDTAAQELNLAVARSSPRMSDGRHLSSLPKE
ncbi:DUF3606 domain-containing protein [Mesorhizobium sp. NZP2298]|nr:DUF3606 domain-containing protein [Mesorhizobium sp. NZP2298]